MYESLSNRGFNEKFENQKQKKGNHNRDWNRPNTSTPNQLNSLGVPGIIAPKLIT